MKKFAVYFTGHFRNLNNLWANYNKMFLSTDKYQFDFYFFLWDTKDHTETDITIKKSDILNICPNAKNIKLYKDFSLNHDYKNCNYSKQFFLIKEAMLNLNNFYDYYIKCRTDLFFFDTDPWDQICSLNSDIILPDIVWGFKNNYPHNNIINDYLWITNYKALLYINSFYDYIPKSDTTYPEQDLANFLSKEKNTYSISHFKSDFNLERRTRGEESHLEETKRDTYRRRILETQNIYLPRN
jgi:hypothetical protein